MRQQIFELMNMASSIMYTNKQDFMSDLSVATHMVENYGSKVLLIDFDITYFVTKENGIQIFSGIGFGLNS